ncbi:hypothetical protein V5P93_004043 [Actinokineospora auranticolor]|uniref:Uncharacterized protein n=1 Tax=Actinokineospora auranticolor TaxID=155976 RepID=A0A2S6GCX7_9PSEU|nr:hypothetical protein [Actinokineospora auranticolor]PPK62787.1 hypothetical protein CLV40_13353 [Actinokineospora auranticolor]
MGLIRALVALHPKAWRDRYGEEFAALLEDTGLTPRAVVDVVAHAGGLRVRAHLTGVLVIAAFLVSGACRKVGLASGLTHNVLWAPTDLPKALLLLGTVGPWLALIVRQRVRKARATR